MTLTTLHGTDYSELDSDHIGDRYAIWGRR